MSDTDGVLERLVTDQAFRTQLREDPVAALGGYDLEDGDLAVLLATLEEGQVGQHGVEQRTSKSAFLTAIMGLSGAGSADGGHPDLRAPDAADTDAARSQCQNNLKQIGIGVHDDDPVQDLAAADGAEESVHMTYPGVYVQETPSPDGTADPTQAPRESADGRQPVAEGWPVKWMPPESSVPPSAPDADIAPVPTGSAAATGADDPTDAGAASSGTVGAEGASGTEGPVDPERPVGAEEPVDAEEPESPEEVTATQAPPTDPADLVAEQRTEEAETVHAFLGANGTDMQGEGAPSRDADLALDDGAGRQDTDR
jgi:hypothetical protein